ncbi:MAG: hypothetical protein ACP5FK_12185 [bacterium]
MSDMISLEKYAELCAMMAETGGDEEKELEITQQHGVDNKSWKYSKKHYTSLMSDPKDMGKTAMAFMPLYQAAQEKLRGGGTPGSLEDYTKVHFEMAFHKDPNNPEKQIDFMVVLERNGFTHSKWLEMESYWTPRVASDTDPKFNTEQAKKFRGLMQEYSDNFFKK